MNSFGYPPYIGHWYLGDKLGSGYSGAIFRASHIYTGQVVALKVQHVNHECPTNLYERHIYPALQGGTGMPMLWASGVEGAWDYLVIDLLGPSLDRLLKTSAQPMMDLRSVCCIAMQVISRLEFMHSRGILHRDIQLGNCVVGLPPNDNTIYMIDFGFSKRYIDPYTHCHIPDSRRKRDFVGNYWFSSVAVHCRGKVPSRRDDLESAALMFIHLLTPRGLPWTRNGVPKTNAAHDRLKQEKRHARPEDLCKGLPQQFEAFLRYCRRLKFQDCPDYGEWREHFRELAEEQGFPESDAFIWPPPEPKPLHPKHVARHTPVSEQDDVAECLLALKKLNLVERQVLGDRKNIDHAIRNAKKDAEKVDAPEPVIKHNQAITVSSTSTASIPPPFLTPKAYKLTKLTKSVSEATSNLELSKIVQEFAAVLKSNSSRTLTKEAFGFLDALYKQLADPSVFIVPMRTLKTRSENERLPENDPTNVKLGVVARLKREVGDAPSSKTLATMVADFGRVTNKSNGRTVTKDGFAFLQGVSERLKVM